MSLHPVKFSNHREAGFTLVEALVSLALLTTALVPTFLLATDAVRISVSIRNTLTAANLAQEGVEVVRAIRDANWFAGNPFDTNLDACAGQGCRVQWNSVAPDALDGNPPLWWDESSGLYQYGNGTQSLFRRKITVDPSAGSPDELIVKSEVTWVERTRPRSVVIEHHLYNWLQ